MTTEKPRAFPHRRAGAVVVLLAGLLALVAGCSDNNTPGSSAKSDGKPTVVVSIPPLASVVQSMLGGDGRVVTLLPAGYSPHGFNATATQMREVSGATCVIIVGLGVDAWAQRAAEAANVRVIAMADLLHITAGSDDHDAHDHDHDHHHGRINAHLWLDPVLMLQFVEAVEPQLAEAMPEHAEAVAANAQRLREQLKQLDADCRSQLAQVPVRRLVTFHNAFDRFAQRYKLEVVAHLAEIQTQGPSITAKEIEQVRSAIATYKLETIYREPQMPATAAKAIEQQTGVHLLVLDPLGSAGESYDALMRRNLHTLVEGQQ